MPEFAELEGTSWQIEKAKKLRDRAHEIQPELSKVAVEGITHARWWVDNDHMVIYKKWWKQLNKDILEIGVDQLNFDYALLAVAEEEAKNKNAFFKAQQKDYTWEEDNIDNGFFDNHRNYNNF